MSIFSEAALDAIERDRRANERNKEDLYRDLIFKAPRKGQRYTKEEIEKGKALLGVSSWDPTRHPVLPVSSRQREEWLRRKSHKKRTTQIAKEKEEKKKRKSKPPPGMQNIGRFLGTNLPTVEDPYRQEMSILDPILSGIRGAGQKTYKYRGGVADRAQKQAEKEKKRAEKEARLLQQKEQKELKARASEINKAINQALQHASFFHPLYHQFKQEVRKRLAERGQPMLTKEQLIRLYAKNLLRQKQQMRLNMEMAQ